MPGMKPGGYFFLPEVLTLLLVESLFFSGVSSLKIILINYNVENAVKLLEFGKFALTVEGWGSGLCTQGEATGELSHSLQSGVGRKGC